jgi:hypothetical protein
MKALSLALAVLLAASAAHAVQDCTLDGQPVNPAHGGTTAGKSGLMRCVERDSGRVQREQQLQNGVFMGLVRFYRSGVLQQEHSTNAQGNRHGRAREFAPDGTVLSDTVYDNGSQRGLARAFHPNGQLRRATWYGDDGREQAVAEFTSRGQPAALRCGLRPLLAPAADDARWCGFAGDGPAVDFFDERGMRRAQSRWQQGERVQHAAFDAQGHPEATDTRNGDARTERVLNASGQPRRELQSVRDGARWQRTEEKTFADSGQLVRLQRWAAGRAVLDEAYYLNGQPKSRSEFGGEGDTAWEQRSQFHDNGQLASAGRWLAGGRSSRRSQPTGTHQALDEQGRLLAETEYGEAGQPVRERSYEAGRLLRDDAVFGDGSRKAFAR